MTFIQFQDDTTQSVRRRKALNNTRIPRRFPKNRKSCRAERREPWSGTGDSRRMAAQDQDYMLDEEEIQFRGQLLDFCFDVNRTNV